MDNPRFDINANGDQIGVVRNFSECREHYINYLSKIPKNRVENIKIGLDLANEASSDIAKKVYSNLAADMHVINDQPDGVNINVACG